MEGGEGGGGCALAIGERKIPGVVACVCVCVCGGVCCTRARVKLKKSEGRR
jgi:hypothetical protein